VSGTRKLGKPTDQRLAMLKTQTTDLLLNGKITTTEARAKEVKSIVDSIIALAIKEKNKQEKIHVAISQKGGKIVNLNKDRDVIDENISREEANKIGKEYLAKIGYPDMAETYFQTQENIITINYVYEQNGIAVYPDLIKVKIALDDGEILGVE